MNRPEKKNALTMAMYDAMAEGIETAPAANIRCLLIGGAPTVFCAGNDIGDFLQAAMGGGLGAPILRFLHALARCEIPLGRGGPRQRGRRRRHHADALRPRRPQHRSAVLDALRQPRPGAGKRPPAYRTAPDGSHCARSRCW